MRKGPLSGRRWRCGVRVLPWWKVYGHHRQFFVSHLHLWFVLRWVHTSMHGVSNWKIQLVRRGAVVYGGCGHLSYLVRHKDIEQRPNNGRGRFLRVCNKLFLLRGSTGQEETSLTEEQIRCAETSELRAEFQTCNVCPQGKHAKVPGQLSCSACPRGQYADDAGRLLCTHCPDDHITVDLGSTDAKECVPCATGQFPSPDFSRCQKCATGQYLDLPTMTCTNCPPGKYSDATVLKDRAPCQVCLPGRYSDTESAEECKNCPNGKFQSAPASTSCEGPGCPMNYGSTVVGALAEIDTTCSPSPQNQYYDKTSGIPLKCPSGRFWHPEVGVPETAVLPPTSFVNDHDSAILACDARGLTGCAPQIGGGVSLGKPIHGVLHAVPLNLLREARCLPYLGKYSDLCATKCETNQVMSQTNTQACEPCAAGWFWSDDSLACVPCPIKHKRNSSELFVLTNFCSPCEASQHALANRTACVGCDGKDGGYYMSTGGSCSACPKGKFSTSLVDDCTTCPDGQSTEIEGSNQCSIVSNGQYTIEGISTACPSGKYSAIEYLPVETTFDCSNCVCETSTATVHTCRCEYRREIA